MPHKAIWVHANATQEIKTIVGDYHPPKGDLLLKTICVAVNPGDFKWVDCPHFAEYMADSNEL
jgi:hypothetical protein